MACERDESMFAPVCPVLLQYVYDNSMREHLMCEQDRIGRKQISECNLQAHLALFQCEMVSIIRSTLSTCFSRKPTTTTFFCPSSRQTIFCSISQQHTL